MNKHTPGPWFVDHKSPFLVRAGDDIDGRHIAHIGPANYTPRFDVDEPNAKLIAAAPDLLEALEACRNELLSMINMHNAQDPNDGSWLYDHQTICEADLAIARARGEA